MEHVRLGRGMSITVIAMITVYLAATPDRPNRPTLWILVAVATTITAIVGVLPWQRLAGSWATADRALYEAERAGRDRVVVAPDQPGAVRATAGPARSPGGPGA